MNRVPDLLLPLLVVGVVLMVAGLPLSLKGSS